MKINAQVELSVPYPQAQVFDAVVHVDVPAVFRGRGLVAAVQAVAHQQGDWNQVGERRQIVLADGGSLWEEITAYDEPQRFDYVLTDIKGALALLVSKVEGEWHYQRQAQTPTEATSTRIIWCYHFVPRNVFIAPISWLFVRLIWMPYMRQVMAAIGGYLKRVGV